MCKFTNRLFVFALFAFLSLDFRATAAAAVPSSSQRDDAQLFLDLLTPDNDYDLHYDQRQKGSENLRLKLDGFVIGLPNQEPSALMLLTDDLLENLGEELLLGIGKNPKTTAAPDNGDNSENYPLPSNLQRDKNSKPLEILAPKSFEARNRGDQINAAEDNFTGSRTKLHIYQLLNLLRRSGRD